MLYYGRSTNQMYLLNDAGTGWLTAPVVNGTTLQNSQCSLDFTNYALASITNGPASKSTDYVPAGLRRDEERLHVWS